jgi:hypothetical protein
LSGLVAFAPAEQNLREVGGIDISQSSIWRRVDRCGRRLQAVEALQQVKAYGFKEPDSLDPNRSRGRMGAAMDGTMVHIREEGWKELKMGCVFDIALRRQFDPHTQEEIELGSAIHNSYEAHLGSPEVFGRQLWAEARHRFWVHTEDSLTLGDEATWICNLVSEQFIPVINWWIGFMPANISPTPLRSCMAKARRLLSVCTGARKPTLPRPCRSTGRGIETSDDTASSNS